MGIKQKINQIGLCKGCLYWNFVEERREEGFSINVGECRVWPPVSDWTGFTETKETTWCGEFVENLKLEEEENE